MHSRIKKTLAAVGASAAAVVATAAMTGTANAASNGEVGAMAGPIKICMNSNFNVCTEATNTVRDAGKLGYTSDWQDSISSIHNYTGQTMCFYEHNDYKGASFSMKNTYMWADMGWWNDRVSSWKPC